MTSAQLIRFIGLALLGLAVQCALFVALAIIGLALFGLSFVRTDAFAWIVSIYWVVGAIVSFLFALWRVTRRTGA